MTDSVASQPSVLLAFRGANVRSFRDEFELSMVAPPRAPKDPFWEIPWREDNQTVAVLPVAAILGANASGKTNVLRAINGMGSFVRRSFRNLNPGEKIPRSRFLLDSISRDAPSRFEVDLVLSGIRYEYGFVITDEEVVEEWAYRFPKGRAALVFHRDKQEVSIGAALKSGLRPVRELLRPNSLFLSTAASANNQDLEPLYGWFSRNLLFAESRNRDERQLYTAELLRKDKHREAVLALLRAADLGVTNVRTTEPDPEMQERIVRAARILAGEEVDDETSDESVQIRAAALTLAHQAAAEDIELDAADESLGTLVWLSLVGPVVDALGRGAVFLADELDASLHPHLISRLIGLFENPETNPHRAQLIFNTHDVTILGDSVHPALVGREQVWFTEKLSGGRSRLYPLSDFSPRKGEAIARRYLAGRFGATPILSDVQFSESARLIESGKEDG